MSVKQLFETYRGVVLPSMCDHFGHMNVRWYAFHFDDAGFHLWTLAGVSHREMRDKGVHVVVAQTTTKLLCARQETVEVFDPTARRSTSIPEDFHRRLSERIVDPDQTE